MPVIDDLARWASTLTIDDIPERVREVARNQVVSVLGAIHASAGCAGGRAVMEAVEGWGEEGPCSCFPGAKGRSLHSALLQNCSLSMALDYDDYLFLGHTGHSAVCVPFAVGQMTGASSGDVLAAQIAANELAGRLGASVTLGPHNGQMWAHIHLLSAAAAASRVLGLDAERTADAMGIAMAEPVYPLFPGFMGPQSKLLTAAAPAQTGAQAAFLAAKGMTGSREILEDEQGFWANFAFIAMPAMMTGLGSAWVTDTMAFKPYPGCAYIDTSMDALFELADAFERERGRPLEPADVREIKVEASLLTIAMDAMSQSYMDTARLSPTNINFSLSVSLAIGLLAGKMTGAELTEEFLDAKRTEILDIASKVNLRHSAPLTVGFLRELDDVIDLRAAFGEIGLRTFLRARRRLKEHLSSVGSMGPREALEAWKSLSPDEKGFLKKLASPLGPRSRRGDYTLESRRFEDITMPFGARVRVLLSEGGTLEAEKLIPRGAPGDPARFEVCEEKFVRESSAVLGREPAEECVRLLRDFEGRSLDEITDALRS